MHEIKKFIKLLKQYNITLSSCESITGGKLASKLTSFNGISNYYKGSIISYSNFSKINIVGINEEIINKYGAISKEAVSSMSLNTNKIFNTDLCISYTGNAGNKPIENKPKGLIYVSFMYKTELYVKEFKLKNTWRKMIINKIIKLSIKWIIEINKKEKIFF